MNLNRSFDLRLLGLVAATAATAPSLLAFNVSPSPTFLNQALAIGLWGLFAGLLGLEVAMASGAGRAVRSTAAVWAVLLSLGASAVWAAVAQGLPWSLAWSAVGLLGATIVLAVSGAAVARTERAEQVFFLFCLGWVVAGLFNAGIAMVQVFAPSWPDGDWIAHSGLPGRAVGNLRQPNHLSSLLLWSTIAVVACGEARRLSRGLAVFLVALLVFAVVLTASRTGLVGVALLALWGLGDRRLSRASRGLLAGTPGIYALSWWAMSAWAAAAVSTFGGQQRLSEGDLSASRFGIWSNTLDLIRANPWTGVGFGEFNFAWSLTPFPGRPTAFFDHTHNLPLQLAVELGLPLAAAVLGLLLWALWRAWRRAQAADAERGLAGRAAVAMLVMIGLHSLLEYPLWYSYFLLPAAWALGYGLGLPGTPSARADALPADVPAPRPSRRIQLAGLLVVCGAAASVVDYLRVAAIFSSAPGAASLEQRIAQGQRSVLFAHHAHYAAGTVAEDPSTVLPSFQQASHYLLDTRLMTAWAQALAGTGDIERARHLSARLREFKNPQSAEFFAECPDSAPAQADAPFQCVPPTRDLGWRDFVTP